MGSREAMAEPLIPPHGTPHHATSHHAKPRHTSHRLTQHHTTSHLATKNQTTQITPFPPPPVPLPPLPPPPPPPLPTPPHLSLSLSLSPHLHLAELGKSVVSPLSEGKVGCVHGQREETDEQLPRGGRSPTHPKQRELEALAGILTAAYMGQAIRLP